MTDLHIRGLDDPDVRLEGMPATQRLWAAEDPYDLEGTEDTFLEAVRENLRLHTRCPFYSDWLERNGVSPEDIRTMDDIVRIPPIPAEFYKTHVVKTAPDDDIVDDDIVLTLTSSGTSGQKSQMFFDEWSIFASDKSADVQMGYYGRITDGPVNFLMYSYEPAEGVNAGTLRTRQMMRRYGRENELVYALRWTGSGHEFDMAGRTSWCTPSDGRAPDTSSTCSDASRPSGGSRSRAFPCTSSASPRSSSSRWRRWRPWDFLS